MAIKVIYDAKRIIADIQYHLELKSVKSDNTIDSDSLRPILVRNRMDIIHS